MHSEHVSGRGKSVTTRGDTLDTNGPIEGQIALKK